ncbi:MAG: NAD-dependent epimerase/dehydratase family protein [Anaerolineae bacterium]
MAVNKQNRVLIVGGGTYLGINIASALLAEGIDVSLIIREGNEKRLGLLESRVRWSVADVWDSASLKGRARGHGTVVHAVGSMVDDPAHGLTFQRLNVVSARNSMTMCVSDGVQHFILLSAVSAPWVNTQYVRAKREAEHYVRRIGLKTSIIRAPITYIRGTNRPLFYRIVTALGNIPPLSWSSLGRIAPMPLDVMARGIARIAKNPPEQTRIYYARHLRQLNKREELQGQLPNMKPFAMLDDTGTPLTGLDDEMPFGWVPTQNYDEEPRR